VEQIWKVHAAEGREQVFPGRQRHTGPRDWW